MLDLLSNELGVSHECYASPLNRHLPGSMLLLHRHLPGSMLLLHHHLSGSICCV